MIKIHQLAIPEALHLAGSQVEGLSAAEAVARHEAAGHDRGHK